MLTTGSTKMLTCVFFFFNIQESIEDRLSAMDIDVMKVKQPSGSLPQTDNFAVLLVQGLESSDPMILNVSIKVI